MDGELAREAAVQGGVFYRWQALDCGYGQREISQLLRENEWRRVRHGAYTTAAAWSGADEAGRHLLVAHAVVGSLEGDVVLTHQTAAAAMKVPLWGCLLATSTSTVTQVARHDEKPASCTIWEPFRTTR